MVSILVLVRDAPRHVIDCLNSVVATMNRMGDAAQFELVLIDDNSSPSAGIVDVFKKVRSAVPGQTQIIRFKTHQHYAHGLAYGFAAARGSSVLFVSHDMILTPSCVRTLLEIAAIDPRAGIIRPVSQHMDYAENIVVRPALPLRSSDDAWRFSAAVREHHGLARSNWAMLIGDAMLVRRDVIDKIGTTDMRYFGFMADVDYGIRARRAGYDLPIAHGAWLHHSGSGHSREAGKDEAGWRQIQERNVADAQRAWLKFRAKWGNDLPADYRTLDARAYELLVNRGPIDGSSDHHAPPALDPSVCEIH